MKKSKILATVMLFVFFSSAFLVVNIQHPTSGAIVAPEETLSVEPNAYIPVPLGDKGIWIVDLTGETMVLDGSIADWTTAGAPHDLFGGADTYIGYDATYVYVAAVWADDTNDVLLPNWNKTGLVNESVVAFEVLDGEDDMFTAGFSDGTDTDLWTWTASVKTDQAVAFEHDDTGDLSYATNFGDNETLPGFDNTQTPIVDYFAIANGTQYDYVFAGTPTGSQTDVDLLVDYTAGVYTIEMRRLLDTTQADDIVLDFTSLTDMSFFIGKANKDDGIDMVITTGEYSLSTGNDVSDLTFDTIVNPVTESLLIKGTAFDDYVDYAFTVEMTGWDDTYGPGSYDFITVDPITGNWSYLFFYQDMDMPLGEHNVTVTFKGKYDAPISMYQTIEIDDILAPQILGLVDMGARYDHGVPNDTLWLEFTVGLSDNYYSNADLTANLYIYKDNGIALQHPMIQFSPGSTTFSANVTLDYDATAANNYTYFVQVWDGNLNKVVSIKYWFIYGEFTDPIPGFGLIAGILGLMGASFILYKKFKK